MEICPICGGVLYEDATEITENDEGYVVDVFSAYVCENNCGYVERLEPFEMVDRKKPNLFHYATSELSQDAFLCWLFEHLSLKTYDIVYDVAKGLLKKIVEKAVRIHPQIQFEKMTNYSLSIERQVHNIDVLLTFAAKTISERIYIIIEDKTNSGESRKNQLEHYKKKLNINDETDVVISVLFKTGYATKKERDNFLNRDIVFIGYEDIYDVFSSFSPYLKDDVILNSWWLNFNEKYYTPIESFKSLKINPEMTLKEYNQLVKKNKYPHTLAFKKITEYFFHGLSDYFSINMFPFQGKGHIDWHYEISRQAWKSKKKNITVSIYFIWDLYKFSLVVKTAPFTYKPLQKLSKEEKREYIHVRENMKAELKKNKQMDWKITHYYLQIAHMANLNDVPIRKLQTKINEEILFISSELDRILLE